MKCIIALGVINQRYLANENSFANFGAAKKRVAPSALWAKTASGLAGFEYSFFYRGQSCSFLRIASSLGIC